jgi:hypothetical protein
MKSQTRNDVASRFPDHCSMHITRLLFISYVRFSVINNGELSVSTARGGGVKD